MNQTTEPAPSAAVAEADSPSLPLWTLPLSALLIGLHWFFPDGPSPTADPAGAARHVTSLTIVLEEYVLLLGGTILLLFGVIALADRMARPRTRRWAFGAKVLSVAAIALFLPVVAVPTLVYPMLGDAYLGGTHPQAAALMAVFSPPFPDRLQVHLFVMLFVALAGSVAMAVTIWRSGLVGRWLGVLYALAFVLTISDTPLIGWVGLLLLFVSGVVMTIRLRPTPANVATQPQGREYLSTR